MKLFAAIVNDLSPGFGCVEKHGFDDFGVIVERYDTVQDSDNGKYDEGPALIDHYGEEQEFADEAGEGRESRQREKENRQAGCWKDRTAPSESSIALDLFVAGGVGNHHHHEKGAKIHDQINHDVEKDRLQTVIVQDRKSHQHVAGMSDARIGEHPLEIPLIQGAEIANASW